MPHVELIHRGEDKTIEITVTDKDDVVIDLDTTSDIVVRLLDQAGVSIEQYNKAGTGEFQPLDIPTPANGIMNLFLNADKTDVASLGFINAEVKLRFADVNFDDGTADAVVTIESIAKVVPSETKDDL